jgi:DNA adenine methylase
VRCNQSFNNAGAAGRAGWASSAAPKSNPAPDFAARANELTDAARRLRTVLIENRPAVEVIAKYGLDDAVLYVDPPYLDSTRLGRDRSRGADYTFDTAGEAERRELATALHATRATVLLSGYASKLYDELFADWHRLDVTMHRGSANHTASRARRAVEVIWSNRPLTAATDDPTLFDRDETPPGPPPCDETAATPVCQICGAAVARSTTGRPRAYCSRAC